jgi:hypothetical protein
LNLIEFSALMFTPSSNALFYPWSKKNEFITQGDILCVIKPSMQALLLQYYQKGESHAKNLPHWSHKPKTWVFVTW